MQSETVTIPGLPAVLHNTDARRRENSECVILAIERQGVGITPDEFGIHRGEFVFIHREGATNGSVMPRVPKISELESWVRDVPSLHIMHLADSRT